MLTRVSMPVVVESRMLFNNTKEAVPNQSSTRLAVVYFSTFYIRDLFSEWNGAHVRIFSFVEYG